MCAGDLDLQISTYSVGEFFSFHCIYAVINISPYVHREFVFLFQFQELVNLQGTSVFFSKLQATRAKL